MVAMKKPFFILSPKLLCILLLIIAISSCKKTDAEPDVLKVYALTETVNGLGYSDIEEISSKWLIGTPPDKSAANDEDGKLSGSSFQPNPNVTILAYNFGGKSVRSLTISASKPVYVPVLGYTYWYFDKDPCDPTYGPAANQTVEAFLGPQIEDLFKVPHTVTAKLNGQDIVPDLKKYMAKSKAFDMAVPDEYQDPACDNKGKKAHTLAHSYALLLKLPKGKHTLVYSGAFPNADPDLNFETEVTWNLTVE
jgi:hypothetical protein